ncbi:hypothetical protein [Halopiger aswanensis]|uniref:Uncharacterized protein n=1 Tax=Halopiger aswanensis TaxID=148449 RepID=A0A3R7GST7_9EURY|nr:hypothetical protein [Halopiger aswanensis]RKD87651.1 hypothetical protein ATJ93_4549 [Halopiger aswanensis]
MGSPDPPHNDKKDIDEVYHDRNLLAIRFATIANVTWPGSAGYYWESTDD